MSTMATGRLTLADVRARAAQALAPAIEGDPMVLEAPVDSAEPNSLIVFWDDPWLEKSTVGGYAFDARLGVLCLAGRIDPPAGVVELERLITYTIARLRDDPYPWPQASSQAPAEFVIGGVHYLGARLSYRVPVSIEMEG